MNGAAPPTADEAFAPVAFEDDVRTGGIRRRLLAGVVAVVVVGAVVSAVVDPFGGGGDGSGRGGGSATSLARVAERALSAQTQVSGTLGFAGESTIRVPVGTAPTTVGEAQGSVASDRRSLSSARAALAVDEVTLGNGRSMLTAAEQRLAVDCAGDNAASGVSGSSQGGSGGGVCADDAQLVSSDRQALVQAAARVDVDEGVVSSAERSLVGARSELAAARGQETVYGQGSIYTGLPSPGRVVGRGGRLYAIDRQPVLLLYGSTVAGRAFVAGMSSGPDVGELNANLDALGDGRGLVGDSFTAATAAAIRALQRALGVSVTGMLRLGSVVFEPGAVRVTGLVAGAGVGASVTPGPLLTVSTTARVVTIQLDASLEGQVTVGDPAIITLPDNTTTPGHVSHVSGVAMSGQNGTTVGVQVVPDDPAATGMLDQAPVQVQITTANVRRALVVPVDALLALAGGRYAVEEVSDGVHRLVAVSTGMFDDADGLVQVSGRGLAAGQRVVVPGS